MGRFFKAEKVELAKDNIYQAPYELMAASNAKEDSLMQQEFDNREVLKEAITKFNYDEIDKDIYMQKNKEYLDSINNITNQYLLDPRSTEAKKALAEVRDKMKTDYSTGTISNVEKTKKNIDQFKLDMEAKGVPESQQQHYLKAYWDKFKTENPNGSVNTYFKPGEILEDVDVFGETAKYVKMNEADIEAGAAAYYGNGYLYANKDTKKILEIEFATKKLIEARPDLKSQIMAQAGNDAFAYRGFGNTNADGIDWNSEYIQGIQRAIRELNYKQEEESKNISSDSTWISNQNRIAANGPKEDRVGAADISVQTRFKEPTQIVSNNNKFLIKTGDLFTKYGVPQTGNFMDYFGGAALKDKIKADIKKEKEKGKDPDKIAKMEKDLVTYDNILSNHYNGDKARANSTDVVARGLGISVEAVDAFEKSATEFGKNGSIASVTGPDIDIFTIDDSSLGSHLAMVKDGDKKTKAGKQAYRKMTLKELVSKAISADLGETAGRYGEVKTKDAIATKLEASMIGRPQILLNEDPNKSAVQFTYAFKMPRKGDENNYDLVTYYVNVPFHRVSPQFLETGAKWGNLTSSQQTLSSIKEANQEQ